MKMKLQRPTTSRKLTVRKARLGLIAMAMGMTGVVLASAPASTSAKDADASATPAKRSRLSVQIGKASWYGKKFNGHKTASGEKFDMNALTCAHRSLPLGSWVRVTNLFTRKALFLRVNDRGPVPKSRLLDVSYAAAQRLGMDGVAKVQVEPVRENDPNMAKAMMFEARPAQIVLASASQPRYRGLPILVSDH